MNNLLQNLDITMDKSASGSYAQIDQNKKHFGIRNERRGDGLNKPKDNDIFNTVSEDQSESEINQSLKRKPNLVKKYLGLRTIDQERKSTTVPKELTVPKNKTGNKSVDSSVNESDNAL